MTPQHPGKVSQGLDAAMGCPPEPALEVPGGPASPGVVPKLSKHLLEQVRLDRFEIHHEQFRKGDLLLLRKVPRVFQPDVARPLEEAEFASERTLASILRTSSMASNKCRTI